MRKCFFMTIILLLLPQIVFGSEPWYMDKPVISIEFEGLHHLHQRDLQGITREFINKKFTHSMYQELQERIYALDYFHHFTARAVPGDEDRKSVIIIFSVEERPLVDVIEIQGNRNIRDREILSTILTKQDDIFNRSKIRSDIAAIKELYLENGYPEIEVEDRIEEDKEENRVRIYFEIQEGRQTRIKQIQFSGNSFASDSTLRRVITTKPQSLFSSGIFLESNIEKDIRGITSYYHENGYIDAKVVDVDRRLEHVEDGRSHLNLVYYIEEGEQWKFGDIEFKGNDLFSDEELRVLVRHQTGDILNRPRLEADFARVADQYYNDGYIYNIIPSPSQAEQRNHETNTINYIMEIVEMGRAHIENIIIKGNEKTKEHVIKREIPLQTGDVFSKEKVLQSLRNLYNTGLFQSVVPETPYGSAEGLMDLVFNLEEARTTDINFGVTFTGGVGEYPIIGFLKWTDNNFRGLGQTFSIGTEFSGRKQSLNFEFQENWLLGRRWSGGVELSLDRTIHTNVLQNMINRFTKEEYYAGKAAPDPYSSRAEYLAARGRGETIHPAYLMEYEEYNIGLGLNTGYRFQSPIGRFGVGTGFRSGLSMVSYDDELYRPYNPTVRENLDTWKFRNRTWMSLSWDTRDFIYNPTSGFYFNQIFTYAGGILGGSSNFIKSQSKAEGFYELFSFPITDTRKFNLVLAAHTSFSVMLDQYYRDSGKWNHGMEAATGDKLYTDGMTIARGWPIDRDGEALWNNWVELRFPIAEEVLWGDFFLSGTKLWDSRDNISDTGIDEFKFSLGGGMRFVIPGLPIGFYLVKPFQIQDGNFVPKGGELFRREGVEGSGLQLVISIITGMF